MKMKFLFPKLLFPIHFFLFLMLILPLLFTQAHSQDSQQVDSTNDSFFWRVDKAELAPSYLLGTVHLGYKDERGLDALYADYFKKSDRLVLEISFEDPELMTVMMKVVNPQKDNKEKLGAPLYKKLIALWQERELNPLQIENSYPWTALMHLMYLPPSDDITLDRGIDILLYSEAKEINKEVIGLESPLDPIDLFMSIPESIIVESIGFVLDNFVDYQKITKELIEAYFSNDVNTVKSFLDGKALLVPLSPELDLFWDTWFKENLLIKRNNNWLPNIIDVLEQGNSFIAVGAGHLFGEENVVTLLREAGYTLTPLNSP